jgi:hypothetical protein
MQKEFAKLEQKLRKSQDQVISLRTALDADPTALDADPAKLKALEVKDEEDSGSLKLDEIAMRRLLEAASDKAVPPPRLLWHHRISVGGFFYQIHRISHYQGWDPVKTFKLRRTEGVPCG